ncbi:acyl-CoA dehydrogenase family protein [Gordonia caeni]|uniref:Acyl-CoA dehydrogenase family protein n=1 Tax=Gordonia caeni TaxID=1007097 RepID=A0ABP7PQ29_9ACTN
MSAVPYDRFRAVFAELAAGAAQRDRSGEHPYALVAELVAAGFGRLRVPTEYGGYDADLPTLFGLLAEAGAADSNVPQILRGHFTTTEILRRERDRAVRDRWFSAVGEGAVFGNAQSEPSALAVDPATATRIHRGPGGRAVVSGTKFYSTGARFADYLRAAAVDETGRKVFVVLPARHEGVEHVDDWAGIGQRQTGSGTTILTSVPVEDDGQIGRELDSLRGLDSFVQIVHLANLTGIARNLVAETVEVVRGRTRTSRHALSESAAQDPDVLAVIGRLQARRVTAETLLEHAARRLEEAHARDDESYFAATYVETSTAQIAVIEAVLHAASEAFDAGGSSTVRTGVNLDRHWRNARTLASHNPVIYKPRVVGDHLVNEVLPVSGYYGQFAGPVERTAS